MTAHGQAPQPGDPCKRGRPMKSDERCLHLRTYYDGAKGDGAKGERCRDCGKVVRPIGAA